MSCVYCEDDPVYGPGKCVRDGCEKCCSCARELTTPAVVRLGELVDTEEGP